MSTQTAAARTSEGWRRPTVIGLAVLVVLIAVSVLTRDEADVDSPFDPRNPKASGDQAVARVLDDHGVDVEIARGQAALLDERIDADTAVVVTNPDQLGPSTLDRLREHARPAGALVVVGAAEVIGVHFDVDVGEPAPARPRPTARWTSPRVWSCAATANRASTPTVASVPPVPPWSDVATCG